MKFLNDVLGEVTISQDNNVITVIYINDNGYSRAKEMYQVAFDQKIYYKLLSYKSVRWLLAYCHKNLDLVFHVPHDLTEHTRTVSALAVDVPNQLLPSDDCTDTVNLPPVALLPTQGDTLLFIDVETTGLGKNDEVIELAIIDINEKVLFHSLFKPSKPISDEAVRIHGITNAKVSKLPEFADLWRHIHKVIEGKKLVFYNASFDTRLIAQTFKGSFDCRLNYLFKDFIQNPVHCLMLEYARYWGDYSPYHGDYTWQKLSHACHQQGIKIDDLDNHRAVGDAIKTARLYKHL